MTTNPKWVDAKNKVLQFRYQAPQPLRMGTTGSAAYDLVYHNPYAGYTLIPPGDIMSLPTGVCLELPQGFMALVLSRSGLASKHGIVIINAPGLIDSDYRGEIKLLMINHGGATFRAESGQRLAQLLIMPAQMTLPILTDDPLSETNRGSNGLGSTGL